MTPMARERRCRLVVAEAGAELGVEGVDGGDRRTRSLVQREAVWSGSRRWCSSPPPTVAISRIGQQRLAAQRGVVGRGELADLDFLDALEALSHDFHVGLDDGFAELAELLHVLLADDVAVLLLRDAELLRAGADREEGAEEGVALHAELQVGAVGGLAGDFEAGQREDANVLLDDLLARPEGQVLPRALAFRVRLPDAGCRLAACRRADWCA